VSGWAVTAPPSPLLWRDGSMSLLVDLQEHAEDPGYAEAAAARRAAPPPPRAPRQVLAGVLVLVFVGVLTGTAAAVVRSAVDQRGAGRAGLVAEVQRRTDESDVLARQAQSLRAEVAARREAAIAGDDAARLRALELAAAAVAVTGPGVVAVLDDRPAGQPTDPAPRGGSTGAGRVLDRDLQELVNGLWAAGAEAVSVNDLRLTARTAIRSAGEAILVDYRPLSPPYVVRAIGAPGRLEPAFVDGQAGRRLATYTSLYGLRFEVRGDDALRLPAGGVTEPRSATPALSPRPVDPGPARDPDAVIPTP